MAATAAESSNGIGRRRASAIVMTLMMVARSGTIVAAAAAANGLRGGRGNGRLYSGIEGRALSCTAVLCATDGRDAATRT